MMLKKQQENLGAFLKTFKGQDNVFRMIQYFALSISELADKDKAVHYSLMSRNVSVVRSTFRLGSELSVLKSFVNTLKQGFDNWKNFKIVSAIELGAVLVFFGLDHTYLATKMNIFKWQPEKVAKVTSGISKVWLFMIFLSTYRMLKEIYKAFRGYKELVSKANNQNTEQ